MSAGTPVDHLKGPAEENENPKVTILFDNDLELFKNPKWNTFYHACVYWVQDAALVHGGGFSIKFMRKIACCTACVRWNNKSLWLYFHDPHISIAISENAGNIDIFDTTNTWYEVLAPLVQSYMAWKVMKIRRELASAEADLAHEQEVSEKRSQPAKRTPEPD